MIKLMKNDPLTISRLNKSAEKRIPLYEERKSNEVRVPFLDVRAKKQRYVQFTKVNGEWRYPEIVD